MFKLTALCGPTVVCVMVCIGFASSVDAEQALPHPGDVAGTEQAPDNLEDAKRQIALLKAEVARLRALIGSAEESQDRTDQKPEAEPEEKTQQTYRSVRSILNAIPKDLLPKRGEGWDRYEWPAVKKWLETNVVGQRFAASAELKSVNVYRWPNADPESHYRIVYGFSLSPTPFMGATYQGSIAQISVYTNTANAQRAERLTLGNRLSVRGDIASVTVTKPDHRQQARATIGLKDAYCRLPGFVLPPKEP